MNTVFNEILGMSFDAVWLIGAVLVTRALLYKAPKYFYKILWCLVGLRLLIPFSLESTLSLAPEVPTETVNRVSQQMAAAPDAQSFSAIGILSVVWLIGMIAFLGYGIISYIRLKVRIFDAVIYKDNIYYCDKIESPFVCGFLKPRIYLPYGLDEETEKYVLQHEKTHIKYADHILKAVAFIVLCFHWFNPLVWVSYFLLCKDIELSCDETVIKKYDAEGCKQYAKALLEVGVNKVKLSACPVAFGEVGIKKRIKSVIGYKKAGKILVCASLCLCVAVAVCFMTEPKVKAKESEPPKNVEETTTESVKEITTERVTEPTTEPTTEVTTTAPSVTEPQEKIVQYYEETIEETYDDSMFENEDDGLAEDPLNGINVLEPDLDFINPPEVTSIYEGVTYNNLGSNSSVIGTKPSNTVNLPTVSYPADPTPTVYQGSNNSYPHFEGNQWVY